MKDLSDYQKKIDPLRDECAVRAALDVIAGRWKPSLLYEINKGPRRYSDLRDAIPDVSAQAMTTQLRQLEADGVIKRTIYPETPQRVEYELTELGTELSDIMDRLEQWGDVWRKQARDGAKPLDADA